MKTLHAWPCKSGDGSKLTILRNGGSVFLETRDACIGATVELAADDLAALGAYLMALADEIGRAGALPRGAEHLTSAAE